MMRRLIQALALSLPLLYLPLHTNAQGAANATCLPDSQFAWLFNSAGVDPCDVAASLGEVCTNGVPFNIPRIDANQTYPGAPFDDPTVCECSSVYYSMLSACAYCQKGNWLTWTEYSENCTTINYQSFPFAIPGDTRVPGWAFVTPKSPDGWFPNISMIIRDNGVADSTGIPSATSTGSITSQTQTLSFTTLSASTPSPSGSSLPHHKPIVGSVVGSVVGGLVGICLTVVLYVNIKKKQARTEKMKKATLTAEKPTIDVDHDGWEGMVTPHATGNLKLYDPNDPSTFPTHDKAYDDWRSSGGITSLGSKSPKYHGVPEPC